MEYLGPKTGTGRPRKWNEPTIHISMRLPYSTLLKIDEMTRPGISRTDVIVALVDAASNADVAKHILREKELEEENEALRKENKELKALVPKLQERIEKLELENQALKQGRSVRSYQDARMLKALAEKAREGVSWKALCAEVLGLRDENKIKRLLKLAFVIKKDKHNRFPDTFYPKDIAEEFHGWVLKRPERDGPILLVDYILYREDTLKAAKGLAVGKAVEEKAPVVTTLKSGRTAEQLIEAVFAVAHHEYMGLIEKRRGKEAKEFLQEQIPVRLEKVLEKIDPADRRRAVLAVIERHEAAGDWNEAFVSNLRRVAMRLLNTHYSKPLEVEANVCAAY